MKKVNFKLFSLVFLLAAFCSVNVFAQKDETKSKKKVVIVKKIKDKDGKVKVERIEKEGQEAEEYIKELKIINDDGEEIDIDIKIDGDVMIESDSKRKRIEVIEIEDINELSDELKQELKDLDIEIDILDDRDAERIIKIQALDDELERFEMEDMIMISDDDSNIENLNVNKDNDETTIEVKTKDGQKKTFKYKGEMPDDVKKELEEMGLKVSNNDFMHLPHRMHKGMAMIHADNSNKAFLGVILGKKTDLGVEIEKVVNDSGAEQAGLKAGDIITAIDDNPIKNSKELMAALKDKKPNDNVTVNYIRGDETGKIVATLSENKKSNSNIWISSDDHNQFMIKRQPNFIIDEDNDNIETIDVEKDNDKTILKIKEKGKDTKIFEWEGEIPDDIKKELEDMGVEVTEMDFNPMRINPDFDKIMIGGGNKAFLGVEMDDEKSDKGVLLSKVVEESAAEVAGLEAGDIITAINDNQVKTFEDLVDALKDKKVDDKITVKYLRDDKLNSTEATLKERKGFSWISEDGGKIKIDMDEDFDFDFDGGEFEINDGDENVFLFRKAGEGGESRPFIGILMEGSDEDKNGVKLLGTVSGSAAEKAGLKKGDVIIDIDGKVVNSIEDVTKAIEGKKVGDKVTVEYRNDMNDSKRQSTEIELGEKSYSKNFVYKYKFDDKDFKEMKKKYKMNKIIIIKSDQEGEEEEEENEVVLKKSINGDNFEDQRVKVFPNPTRDQLTVQFEAKGNPYTLTVQDISGKEIHREEVKDGVNYDKQLDISQAASGIVIVTITQGDDIYKMKVLKQ